LGNYATISMGLGEVVVKFDPYMLNGVLLCIISKQFSLKVIF